VKHANSLLSTQLTSAQAVHGATVKLGLFSRAQVFVYGYDDGRYVVGYPLHVSRDSYVVVALADVPWPEPAEPVA
jgi:hypothetical protein